MKDPIEQAMRRTQQYWHIDGLTEIGLGVICLLLGIYFYLQATLASESILKSILDSGLLLFVLAASLAGNRLLAFAKQHITYPRTGFVSYRKEHGKQRWLVGGVAALIATLVSVFVITSLVLTASATSWMPAITGLIMAIVQGFLGYRAGSLRFFILSLISLLIGFGLSLIGLGDILGTSYFYLLFSLFLLISGGFTLLVYLRNTRPIQE